MRANFKFSFTAFGIIGCFSTCLLSEPAICFKPASLPLDQSLQAMICDVLGTDQTYPLQPSDLLRLPRELDFSDAGIQSLTGIEYASNTEAINLAHNNIQDLRPLLGLSNLKAVTLAYNQIDYTSSSTMVAAVLALQNQGVWVDYALDTQRPLDDFNDDALMLSKYLVYNPSTPAFEDYQRYISFPGQLFPEAMGSAHRPNLSNATQGYASQWMSERLSCMPFLISQNEKPPTVSNLEDAYRLRNSLIKQNLQISGGLDTHCMSQNFTLDELLERVRKDLAFKTPNQEISDDAVYEYAMKLLTAVY